MGIYFRVTWEQSFTWRAGKILHRQMIGRVLEAPVNLYFDVTPIGRILNKFSKDLNTAESQISWQIGFGSSTMFQLLQVFIVSIYAVKWIGIVIPVVCILSYLIVAKAALSIKETVRIQSTTRSPLLSYLGETISGCSTIRAFDRSEDFIQGNNELLNNNIIAVQMMTGVSSWFAMRVDILAITIMLLISMTCIYARNQEGADPVILSMLLSYVMTIQFSLTWALKCFMYLQSSMVNADRCMKVLEVPQERKETDHLLRGRDEWPEHGSLSFHNVSLKYRPTTDTVLH